MSEQGTETTVVETVESVAVTTPASTETTPATSAGDDLGKVRDLVLKAHPDVVSDLVTGSSVDELIASVEPARSAYQRIADQVRGGGGETTVTAQPGSTANEEGATTVGAQPPTVPAGGAQNVVDPAAIPPTEKIARGLGERRR